ncbi:hypothetical protein GCM10027568_24020 [Humibacter soli]
MSETESVETVAFASVGFVNEAVPVNELGEPDIVQVGNEPIVPAGTAEAGAAAVITRAPHAIATASAFPRIRTG